MRRTLLLLALLFISFTFAISAYADDSDAIIANDSNGLTVVNAEKVDTRTVDVTFSSPLLAVDATVRLVVPNDYQASDESYPVIYLLHGGGGSHTDWTGLGASDITQDKNVILVQPGAGGGSWFVDAELPGIEGIRAQWESYLIDQLIPWVDQHLRTIDTREGRAIAGLSMGGYGTMMLASRHPHLFISASAFSGAIDLSDSTSVINTNPVEAGTSLVNNLTSLLTNLPNTLMGLPGFLADLPTNLMHLPNDGANPIIANLINPTLDNVPLISNWVGVSPLIEMRPPYTVFGPFPLDKPVRLSHNPVTLAANLRGMHLGFYYGNGTEGPLDGDPNALKMPGPNEFMGWIQEDRVEGMNHRMEARLDELGIPYENCQQADYYIGNSCAYGNGMHSGGYWRRSFADELPAILYAFNNPSVYPSPATEFPLPPRGNALTNGNFSSGDDGWQCHIEGNCGINASTDNDEHSAWVQAQTLPLSLTDPMGFPDSIIKLFTDLPNTLEASVSSLVATGKKLAELGANAASGDTDLQNLLDLAWQDIHQTVEVTPFTVYRLSARVKTRGFLPKGEIGVRTTAAAKEVGLPANLTLRKRHLDGDYSDYTDITLDVDSGANNTLTIYAGFMAIDNGARLDIETVSFEPRTPADDNTDDVPVDEGETDTPDDHTDTPVDTPDDNDGDNNATTNEDNTDATENDRSEATTTGHSSKSGGGIGGGLLMLILAAGWCRQRQQSL